MLNSDPIAPIAISGWGEGYSTNLVESILNNKSHSLKHPELFQFQEITVDSEPNNICTKKDLLDKSLILTKLAQKYNVAPNNILIIETQEVKQGNKSHTLYRFHQAQFSKHIFEYTEFLIREIPIRNPWSSKTPGIFYQLTIKKTQEKKNLTNDEANKKVDNLFACLFNSFDLILDLANKKIYKRKLCIDIEDSLSNMRHMDSVIMLDQTLIRKAIADKIADSKTILDFNSLKSRIFYCDKSSHQYRQINKNILVLNNITHYPYAAEHNYILIKLGFLQKGISFLIHMPSFEKKYILGQDIQVNKVIPFFAVNKDMARLEDSYYKNSNRRIVGNPIASLELPLLRVRKKAESNESA